VSDIMNQWPRPRIGERVRLRSDKKVYEVITVRGAKDILRTMDELQAMRFRPNVQSRYGKNWLSVYYRIEIRRHGVLEAVEPNDVEEVLPPD